MTLSIVARSATGDAFGVAVASRFLAVGAAVPAAGYPAGALASQAAANLAYRGQGLQLLAGGAAAAEVVAALTGPDPLRHQRQLGVVAGDGPGASWTGTGCHPWAGGRAGQGYAVQGNILAGPEVVSAMELAWLASPATAPLARRLLAALAAGDAAGGDRRGRQSAALLVASAAGGYGGGTDVEVDLRVDDHPEPVGELHRLLDLHELYFGRPDPAEVLPLTGELADEVATRVAALGHPDLESWMGVENYEQRWVDGGIDPVVLARLRAAR